MRGIAMYYKVVCYCKFNSSYYVLLVDEYYNTKEVKLSNIEYIEDKNFSGSKLKTKDGIYELVQNTEQIEKIKLPKYFSWHKTLIRKDDIYYFNEVVATNYYYNLSLSLAV